MNKGSAGPFFKVHYLDRYESSPFRLYFAPQLIRSDQSYFLRRGEIDIGIIPPVIPPLTQSLIPEPSHNSRMAVQRDSADLRSDLVTIRKVRYICASRMYTYQFLAMQHVAERNGWTKFIRM